MKTTLVLFVAVLVACAEPGMSEENKIDPAKMTAPFPGSKSSFHGFDQYDFELEGRGCRVVVPKAVADGKPWVWRAQFWGHQPQVDTALLKRGYHVAYAETGNSLGSPAALAHWDDLYEYLRFEHLFADRPVLEGMSRGGLLIFRWAAQNPDKVACIYADNPVCDFKSWPGGKGVGKGSPGDWKHCLKLYGLTKLFKHPKFLFRIIRRLISIRLDTLHNPFQLLWLTIVYILHTDRSAIGIFQERNNIL